MKKIVFICLSGFILCGCTASMHGGFKAGKHPIRISSVRYGRPAPHRVHPRYARRPSTCRYWKAVTDFRGNTVLTCTSRP